MIKTQVLVVGGGIVGAGLFRELALHQVSVVMIDKFDFCSQTSQGSSKMLHGGLRYLETMDFGLVEEALEEKNLWLKMVPHLTFEALFHLPVYKVSKYPLPFIQFGLTLYDALSHFKNKPHSRADASEVITRFPDLNHQGLVGAGIYHDGIVDDHKLGLECIYDGLIEPKAHALNYHSLKSVNYTTDGVIAEVEDTIQGIASKISADYIVFATGPFTDKLLGDLHVPWSPQLLPSKGVHLWLKPQSLALWGPLLLNLKDGRVLFIIPQREAILVGTTETKIQGSFENLKATHEDVEYLLSALREFFPKISLTSDDILSTTAAIRPLVKESGSDNLGKASRFHKIYQPNSKTYVILGGKYTTFRRMAQDLNKKLIPRLGIPYSPQLTLAPLRQDSLYPTFHHQQNITTDLIDKILKTEKPKTWSDVFHRRLSQINYRQDKYWGKTTLEWEEYVKHYQR
jgi:glycerol-3-phosphate dehydrogenase